MDRQLAERMVGAACLLAVLVLVVPAILDGNPDSGATITHPAVVDDSLDLRTHTIRLDADEREPPVPTPVQAGTAPDAAVEPEAADREQGPATPDTDPRQPDQTSVVVPVSPQPVSPQEALPVATRKVPSEAEAAAPQASPEPATAGGNGDWFVQLGSFSKRDNAERLAGDLKRKGFASTVLGGGGASGSLFRVRAGPVADKAAADALATRLAAAGFGGGRVGRK